MERLSRSDRHRPWPAPRQPWVMAQRWQNLLFAHWPVPPDCLRPVVPEPLELDTFGGRAWLGIIPFRLTGIRLRWLPPLPFVSSFSEINVRTYVTLNGKPGVFFLSMDAGSRPGTAIARSTFRVPYTYADVAIERSEEGYCFHCARLDRGRPDATFQGTYRPCSPVLHALPGSLEAWLTERYCYYNVSRGKAYRCDITHAVWPLQRAEASIRENSMTRALGIDLPRFEPHLLYARRMDAKFWWVRRAARGATREGYLAGTSEPRTIS